MCLTLGLALDVLLKTILFSRGEKGLTIIYRETTFSYSISQCQFTHLEEVYIYVALKLKITSHKYYFLIYTFKTYKVVFLKFKRDLTSQLIIFFSSSEMVGE